MSYCARQSMTKRLLSLFGAFWGLDLGGVLNLLVHNDKEAVRRDCSELWWMALRTVLPLLLGRLVVALQGNI